jgi:F-type H+-transporting ATPase subunit epsilon
MSAFALEVVAPEERLVSGPATSLVLRTAEGFLTVLDGHAPLIGTVEPGEVRVELEEGEVIRLAVHGGFLQVDTSPGAADDIAPEADGPIPGLSTRVTLLVGVAEIGTAIDVERAQAAKEAATSRLAELRAGRGDEGDETLAWRIAEQEAALSRAEVRLDVAAVVAAGS